jgi:hypothetical protein
MMNWRPNRRSNGSGSGRSKRARKPRNGANAPSGPKRAGPAPSTRVTPVCTANLRAFRQELEEIVRDALQLMWQSRT